MFLVAPDGQHLQEVVHDVVGRLCSKNGYLNDEEALLNAVLCDPELASLLNMIRDDESGQTIFDSVVAGIARQVSEEFHQRHAA